MRKTDVEKLLWKNFWVMIILVFLGIAVPYFMIVGLTNYYENDKYEDIQSASERMQDDYTKIRTDDIVAHNGSVSIVTGDLKVIQLAGGKIFGKEVLSRKEWSDFLANSGKLTMIEYDIAYNEAKDFWLIIGAPVALTIRIEYASNADSPENEMVQNWMILIVICYFLLLGIGAILYAKLIAKRLTGPIRSLCEFTTSLELGDYQKCQENSKIKEIQGLQKGLNHLSEKLKQHEEDRDEMEEQQKELVMEISHDLKNPLASIQGYSEMLLGLEHSKMEVTDDKKLEYLKLIHSNGKRANELLLSLFYFSQIESKGFALHMEKKDICEYVRLLVADMIPVIEEKGFELEADIPDEECYCCMDTKMLQRVFDNLFTNAIKYNSSGTKIQILVSKRLDTAQQERLCITFSDNGVGIPKEDTEKIFQPFKRLDNDVRNSKDGGSGLGLAIVKRIITLHQGTVKLISDTGKGCKFIIELPMI